MTSIVSQMRCEGARKCNQGRIINIVDDFVYVISPMQLLGTILFCRENFERLPASVKGYVCMLSGQNYQHCRRFLLCYFTYVLLGTIHFCRENFERVPVAVRGCVCVIRTELSTF